ncbi:uncharacterized protein PGTG_16334 [Puccinia graminis f. sp. tritici CRL 75-36-700-3]|uniref:Uncharacterized protein n=1 Tax=Puccinia graminis f. sp. tritici (strain CRL 75-36-700-3 / race SCCL) TaxID=418459 RepID=E3L1B3_PUCGT|nr:uncharacterized protein PGTG_16334 [Puccinia graminis f. sp. tritici CRL 75-36-700-3]EFP90308.2 hypothetical protein PGTG_16334 [Puccinia graminis f. sp. tritici CRL 75-36-700-3]
MSDPNQIQALSNRVKDSSQQQRSTQSTHKPPSSLASKTIPQPKGSGTNITAKSQTDPKGSEATPTKSVEPDPNPSGSVTRTTLKNPVVEIIDDPVDESQNNVKATASRAKEIILAKAVKAQEDGDEAKADRFFAMYDTLAREASPKPTTRDAAVASTSLEPIPTSKKRPIKAKGMPQVRGIKFIWANTNSHDNGGFTPYFHKNLLELKGPIPLTIFNKAWQEEALSYHSKNRPKTDESSAEKNLRYHGLAVPDEWLQSFSDWTLNHRCFHETIRERYNYPVLAKVEKDGEESFSNISQFKPETADDTHSEARNFNELGVKENPYSLGGVEARMGPPHRPEIDQVFEYSLDHQQQRQQQAGRHRCRPTPYPPDRT